MAELADNDNDILAWLRAGFDPHPVIPPGVELHPKTKVEPKNRGKSPGLLVEGTENVWTGMHWLLPPAERARRQRTERWSASFLLGNGGLATGRKTVAVDIDCLIPGLAERLRDLTLRVCGWSPVRVGRAPKCLLIYTTAPDELEQPTRVFTWTKPGLKVQVEILGTGRQFVCKGVHPETMQPYAWSDDPLLAAEAGLLVSLTNAKVRALIDALHEQMTGEGWELAGVAASGGRRNAGLVPPPVETLRAQDMKVLASAVAAIPNEPDTPREDYIALGYALRAAAGKDREMDGFLLWHEWAEKWEPIDPARANTIETCEADWARLKPPFHIGADYIYDLAAEHGWSRLPVIRAAFAADPLPDLPPPPPLPDDDDVPAMEPHEQVLAADLASDLTVVANFNTEHGDDLLYNPDRKQWRAFDGGIWQPVAIEDIQARMVRFIRGYAPRYFPPGSKDNDRMRDRLTSGARIGAYLKLAPATVGRRRDLAAMGNRTDILVTPAGVIEMRPGLPIRETRPDDFAIARTAVSPAPPGSTPGLFLQTLGFACAGVQDGVDYVQLALGNMLLGNPAQIVLILWGRGGNGKSTVLEVIKAALGSGATGYATASVLEMWQKPVDFATVHLAGKRAAIAAEFSPDLGWNEALLKAITGGDSMLARDLHQSFNEQRTACMPIFAFNEPPKFRRINEAVVRRLSVIAGGLLPGAENSRATIVEKDEGMKDRIIATELPAVLRWMLDGTERVLAGETALARPDDVMRGIEALIGEQDRIAGWIAANFIRTKSEKDRVALAECVEILKAQISRDEDEETQRRLLPHIDSRQFANRARMAGYDVSRGTGGVAVFKGVRLRGRLYDEADVIDFTKAKRKTKVDWSA